MSYQNVFESLKYTNLSHLQVGRIGEYWYKLILTLKGFDTYTSEVDDKGIDFIVRVNDSQHIDIQVKTIRKDKSSYVFITKNVWKDITRKNLYLGLVILENEKLPQTYLIPSTAWQVENGLFRNREYNKPGQKSVPEWGLNISKRNMKLLEEYKVEQQLGKLKPAPEDEVKITSEEEISNKDIIR